MNVTDVGRDAAVAKFGVNNALQAKMGHLIDAEFAVLMGERQIALEAEAITKPVCLAGFDQIRRSEKPVR